MVSVLAWIQPDPPEEEVFSGLTLDIWAPDGDEFPTFGPLILISRDLPVPSMPPIVLGHTASFSIFQRMSLKWEPT